MPDPIDPVRFYVRTADVMLPGVRGYAGWTIIDIQPDPTHPGTSLVEVEDPQAPAAAAGKICDPQFERLGGGRDEAGLELPFAVRISDYGIPAHTVDAAGSPSGLAPGGVVPGGSVRAVLTPGEQVIKTAASGT